MKRKPYITTRRAAEIYKEILTCRRMFCGDHQFFKITELWEELCCESETWKIKTFRRNTVQNYKLKAGVVAFDDLDLVTLTVDEELWARAKCGAWMENYVLAHELSHVALGHHAKGAVTKNFQVFASPAGLANIPPNVEEEEANYAAVFLQCGAALEDSRWEAVELARRAFSDPSYVRKAQAAVRLDIFQNELKRLQTEHPRVIL